MRHLTRVIAHNVGDLTAAFLYPIFCAFFDAVHGEKLPRRTTTND